MAEAVSVNGPVVENMSTIPLVHRMGLMKWKSKPALAATGQTLSGVTAPLPGTAGESNSMKYPALAPATKLSPYKLPGVLLAMREDAATVVLIGVIAAPAASEGLNEFM